MNLNKATAMLIIFCLTLALLVLGRDFLIPIVIAIGVWFFFNAIANKLGLIKIKGKSAPLWLRYIFASISIGTFFYLVSNLINKNVKSLQTRIEFYQKNLGRVEQNINDLFGIQIQEKIPEFVSNFDISTLLSMVVDSLTLLVSNTFLVIVYLIFLLLEQRMFSKKLQQIFNGTHEKAFKKSLNKVKSSIESYILVKTLTSFSTGVLSYAVLMIIGVDFAFFWAFLIFLLNYIPNVGSMVATIFPAILTLIQFDTLWPAFFVLFGIGAIQFTIGNFVEPRAFGKSLNISALVVILSLAFWGFIWGLVGMFLCVPITVIIMIILSNFEETKPFAVLLSDDGIIDEEDN